MRRNLGNEVLMAVGGLGIIICGLIFAILLSGSSDTGDSTAIAESNTDDITATIEVTADVEMTDIESPTDTPVPTNTETSSDTPAPTDTESASDTPAPKNTELPTDTPIPTDTESPSDTPTPTETDAPEDIETSSDTPVPTDTESPSDTPVPTNTDAPSKTPAPTDTEQASDTPVPTNTVTVRATDSASIVTDFTGVIPTLPPSPTVSPPDEPTRTPTSCRLPQGWTSYNVQLGDTLFAISLATNSNVDELRFANCINNIDNITAGDTIFVPIAPVRPVSTAVPSHLRGGLAAIGCTSPATQITSPITAQRVSGTFTVFGTATRPDFQYYKIEVRPDFASIYNFYSDSYSQVNNGNLGQVNADLFGLGLHWLRLSVVDLTASIPADAICEIPVIFE